MRLDDAHHPAANDPAPDDPARDQSESDAHHHPSARSDGIPGCRTSCAYERQVDLRLKGTRLRGTITSQAVAAGPEPRSPWRQRKGADQRLVVLISRSSGAFDTRRPVHAGTDYVTVTSPEQRLCASATSRAIRIKSA